MTTDFPTGCGCYDPNSHERTGEAGYEEERSRARLEQMIMEFDVKEELFWRGAGRSRVEE